MTDLTASEEEPEDKKPLAADPAGEEDDEDVLDEPVAPPPYGYDPAHAAVVAPLLAAETTDLTDTFNLSAIGESPEGKAALGDEGLRREVVALGLYRVRVARGGGEAGGSLEPFKAPEAGWYLVCPIRSTSEDVRKLWEDLAAVVAGPVLTSRLHDLCFSARHGDVGAHGAAAVDAYLQWPATALEPLHVSEGIARAWTIARSMQNEGLEHAACIAARDYTAATLAADGNPGTIFPLLELLCTKVKSGTAPVDSATVAGLLADAQLHPKFQASYLQVRAAHLIRRIAADEAEREAADRLEVQAHLNEAEGSLGLAKVVHLRSAAQAARNLGVKDLEAQALAALQDVPVGENDMALLRASVELPAYVIGAVLRPFDEADDWRGALHEFLHTPCPSGSYDKNVKGAQAALNGSLRSLFGTIRFGAHGLPEQSADTPDEKLNMEVTSFELLGLDNWGRWFATGLRRMPTVYGIPDTDDIVAFLMDAYRCDQGMATGFATALRLFWQEEYTASVHVSVPHVEQGVRRLLLLLNEPVYRVEKGKTIGQFPGLGSLLPLLVAEGFDRDWERFIGALLLPRGHNLRNLVAHGFVDGISPRDAASALRAAGLMTLASPADDVSVDPQTIRQNLGDPLATVNAYRRLHPIRALLRRTLRTVGHRLGRERRS